jgi:hypothetical protein
MVVKTYNGLSSFSHPSRASSQYVHVAISSLSGVGVYFQPASTICIRVNSVLQNLENLADLLNLTLPTFLAFMGPFIRECSFPRLDHTTTRGVFLAEFPILSLDHCDYRPSTVRGVFKMLDQRIVTFFPSIDVFPAEKASNVIGTFWARVVEESGFRKLEKLARIVNTVEGAYLFTWHPFVGPF